MKNNRVFIICPTSYSRWQMQARNAERKVESDAFYDAHGRKVCDVGCFVAFSPRFILDGREGRFLKWLVLRLLMLKCKYVFAFGDWKDDRECRKEMRFARLTFRKIITE